jgi:alpha-1,2-mannosyltransferase
MCVLSVGGATISPVTPEPARPFGAAPPAERWWRLLGVLVLTASAFPLAWHYLVSYPREIWQVDLQVYREGAKALVTGVPLYELRTDAPQFLPFTYPPFAAFTALPLLLAPFSVIGWVWTVLQYALLWYIVGVAFRPLLERFGRRAGLAQGVVAGSCVWLLPVAEGVRFGQVNAVVVALCLWDVTRRTLATDECGDGAVPGRAGAEGSSQRVLLPPAGGTHVPIAPCHPPPWAGGSGVGVGLAAAVKLTPGVFWLHWALARRWRALTVSLGTAALVTAASALALPPASTTYWTDALLDPDRLGPNAGTSNQSLRGVLLRLLPFEGAAGSAVWLACVVGVLVGGLALSRRLDRLGEPVAVVATLGMVAFLVSPVSWVHHMHWGVVVLGAVLGNGRNWRRVAVALAGAVLLWIRLPWWGANLVADPDVPRVVARVVQNSYSMWALLALLAIWLLVARRPLSPQAGSGVDVEHDHRAPTEESLQSR